MKNYMKFTVILFLIFFLILISSALQPQDNLQENKLDQIRTAIKEKGAEWTAGETWVSRLSTEEFKKLLGLKEPGIAESIGPPLMTDYPSAIDWTPGETCVGRLSLGEFKKFLGLKEPGVFSPMSPPLMTYDYPSAIDWRNKDGYNWVTSIKDQEDCGSCVAFGACATLESLVRIESSQPNKEIDLSEMTLLMCGGGSCGGWYNDSACTYLMNNGTSDENCWPYQPQTMACSNSCSNWPLRAVKITDFRYISGVEACKTYVAIAPILAGMRVYEDFANYDSGIYEHVSGGFVGNHAICIVGYDTNYPTPYWICKNSWGSEDWGQGENGFFKIKMGECEIETFASYWMSGNILPTPPTQAPSNLSAYSTSWYDVILNWQDNSNNSGWFEVQHHKAGDPFSTIGVTADDYTSSHDYWFNGNYTYSYQVRAVNLGGNSSFSNTIDFTINGTPINEPSFLDGHFSWSTYEVELTWSDSSDNEQGFKIERKSEWDPTWQEIDIADSNITWYFDSNVDPDTFYYYRVRAYNPNGNSSYSAVKQVYVPWY
jgi:hypothetical protein